MDEDEGMKMFWKFEVEREERSLRWKRERKAENEMKSEEKKLILCVRERCWYIIIVKSLYVNHIVNEK